MTAGPKVAGRGIAADLAGYSISLSGSTNALPPGYSLSLTANANQDVGPTPYYIEIYDQSTGGLVARCATGWSCSGSSAQGASTHYFIAYIGSWSDTNPPGTIAATSNSVYCTWLSISVSTSPQYTSPGTNVTVTGYANTNVGPTPYWIEIFDASTGQNLAICASGSSCAGSETQYGPTVHSFVAYISGYGTANPPPSVQVSSSTYAVWFGISLAASPEALSPGGTTTLTASANADVGPSPYWISIFDQTAGSRVALCATGSSCSVAISQGGSTVRDYVAYVSSNATTYPPSGIQATSNSKRVTWLSVTLGATARYLGPGNATTLVASASQDIGPTIYLIQIYDQATSSFLFQCATGSSCSYTLSQPAAGAHNFVAYINCCGTSYPPPAPRATSNVVTVYWLSITLAIDYSYRLTGTAVNLTATANTDITNSPYSIEIYDVTTYQNVKECRTGQSCPVAVPQSAVGVHNFNAYIATTNTAWPPTNTQASSNMVTVTWVKDCTPDNSCDPTTFGDDIFVYINAPATASNEYAMRAWETKEGGGAGCPGQPARSAPWANSAGPAGNPINTTQPEPGSTNWNSVPVQIYHDYGGHTCWFWGVKANGDTLLNGYYPNILAVLRSPNADNHTQCLNLSYAVGHSPWGTGFFDGYC